MADSKNKQPGTIATDGLPRHGRIPWFAPGDLDARGRALYDAITTGPRAAGRSSSMGNEEGRLYGPFNALFLDAEVGDALQELGAAIRYRSAIPAGLRELAIVQVASTLKCETEWRAHSAIARQLGVAEEDLDAIQAGAEPVGLSEEEILVCRLTSSLVVHRDLTDEEFASAESVLGLTVLGDLVFIAGYYSTLATSMAAFRVPLAPGRE